MLRTRYRARGGGTPWQLQLRADGVDPTLALQFDRQRYAVQDVRTNYVYNSTFSGVSGIAIPNMDWVQSQAGISRSYVGTGVEDGKSYIDLRFSGTASVASKHTLYFNSSITHPPAALGQIWTSSFYARIVAGDKTNVIAFFSGVDEMDSGNSYLTASTTNNISSLSSSLSRFTQTKTMSNASVAKVAGKFQIEATNGTAIDITIRIYAPQLEMRSVTTAYIPTSAGAVTVSNYAAKSFADILTATRSTTGTYFDASGVMRLAAINEMRFDYDPVTGESLGLLLEGSRTNISPYSVPTSGQWGVSGSTDTYNNQTSPDGTTTAALAVANAGSFVSYSHSNIISFTAGVVYSSSVFVKAGTINRVQLALGSAVFLAGQYANFLLDGDGSVTASSGVTATIEKHSNGWYRVSITATAAATATGVGIAVAKIVTGSETRLQAITWSGTESIYVWGAQCEAGLFPSSYIPTTSGAVTRAADVVLNNASNTVPFASWYNSSAVTVYCEFSTFGVGGTTTQHFYNINDNTNNNGIANYINNDASPAGNAFELKNATVNVVNENYGDCIINGDLVKTAFALELNNFAICMDGLSPVTDATGTIPTLTQINFGNRSSNDEPIYGHIRALYYYPVRVSDAELQRITTRVPTLDIFKQGVANLLGGTSDLRVLNIGDSTTIGINAAGNWTDPNEYKYSAATLDALVPNSNQDAFFGFSTSGGNRITRDPRIVNTGGAISSTGCLGGLACRLATAGNNIVFTPLSIVDTFRVYWFYNGAVNISIQATGGTAFTATLNSGAGTQFGATDIRYVDVSAASLTAGNAVTISKTGGAGNFEVIGIEASDSTAKKLQFTNCGHWGSKSSDWATTTGLGRLPSDFLSKVPSGYYQLATIKAGINDANSAVSIATFKANIQTVIDACKSGEMDVILESDNPISAGTTPPYITALDELALVNNLFFVNHHDDVFVDYTNANSNGWMADSLHPSASGFEQQATVLTNLLIAQGRL